MTADGDLDAIAEWCDGSGADDGSIHFWGVGGGYFRAGVSDWVIQGIAGEFFARTDEYFQAHYVKANVPA